MKSFLLTTMVFALLMMSGCGDLMGKKVVKKKLESERFRADCELDVNAFTDVLERNISSDLRCLEENINLFIKVVKTNRPGTLSRVALEQYVTKNRPDIKPEMVRAMKSIFQLNHLVTGEDPDYISSTNVKKLVDFAVLFNGLSSQHYRNTFGNTKRTPWDIYRYQRSLVSDSAISIAQSLRLIFNRNRNGDTHKVNIIELLDNLTTEDNREEIDKLKKLLFVKRVILGGSSDELSHVELEQLLHHLEPLLTLALDGIRFKHIEITQNFLLNMLEKDLENLSKLVFHSDLGNRDNTFLFSIDQVMDVARMFISKEDFDVDKFDNLIREAKIIVMGGNRMEVKGMELKRLFDHGFDLLKTGNFIHNFYNKEAVLIAMVSPFPVTLDFSEYRHNYPNHKKELQNFERIVKKYRFFKGEFESPYYITGYKRNADGIFEVYLLEYLIKLVFETFGAPSPNGDAVGGYSIDQFQMHAVFKKFEKDLVELGLLSPLWPTVTADNVSLLGTLFQYQSDKNKVMDVNEATEFGISLISSLGMANSLMDYFKAQGCEFDQFGRLEPNCLRRNFFQGMCKSYRSYYPLLFSSLGTTGKCEDIPMNDFNTAFLERAIEAARPCMYYTDGNKEEIWYNEGDVNTMLMVIVHSETTVLRWDLNNNNILDADEVNKAYDIYSPALDGFLETRPAIIKKFKKQIYQYLIKYEEVPDEKNFKSVLKFLRFLMSFNKSSHATRKTIASVLKAIGDENKKLPTAPRIDCNLLRDPENLPTNPEPLPFVKDNRTDYSGLLNGYLDYID